MGNSVGMGLLNPLTYWFTKKDINYWLIDLLIIGIIESLYPKKQHILVTSIHKTSAGPWDGWIIPGPSNAGQIHEK